MNVFCPKCGQEYEIEESFIGQNVECQKCGEKWTISKPDAPKPDAPETQVSEQRNLEDLKESIVVSIWDAVKNFVKANLKAPMTAVFEADGKKDSIAYLGDKCFEINSTVDSQNSYGALVRNYFTAIVFYGENGILPVMIKIHEKPKIHTIKPKEIHCLLCRKNFFHDVSFEPATLLCPYCGKETTYIDMSATGCLKKFILLIIAIPIIAIFLWAIYLFFFVW